MSLIGSCLLRALDARVQSTMNQKLTVYYLQNAVGDLILAEQFIVGVTQDLVDNSVTLAKAFIKERI